MVMYLLVHVISHQSIRPGLPTLAQRGLWSRYPYAAGRVARRPVQVQ